MKRTPEIERRNAQICDHWEGGMSQAAIGRLFGLHRGYVREILCRAFRLEVVDTYWVEDGIGPYMRQNSLRLTRVRLGMNEPQTDQFPDP